MSEIKRKLNDWIHHLQDIDSTGAWNDNDNKMFSDCVRSLKLQELVKEKIKECKRNIGGMVYGMALESLVEESEC